MSYEPTWPEGQTLEDYNKLVAAFEEWADDSRGLFNTHLLESKAAVGTYREHLSGLLGVPAARCARTESRHPVKEIRIHFGYSYVKVYDLIEARRKELAATETPEARLQRAYDAYTEAGYALFDSLPEKVKWAGRVYTRGNRRPLRSESCYVPYTLDNNGLNDLHLQAKSAREHAYDSDAERLEEARELAAKCEEQAERWREQKRACSAYGEARGAYTKANKDYNEAAFCFLEKYGVTWRRALREAP